MPFGESFLTTIKSNKSIMLDKSKRFRKSNTRNSNSKKDYLKFNQASTELLSEIKVKIRKENRSRYKQEVYLMVIILFVLSSFVIYMLI